MKRSFETNKKNPTSLLLFQNFFEIRKLETTNDIVWVMFSFVKILHLCIKITNSKESLFSRRSRVQRWKAKFSYNKTYPVGRKGRIIKTFLKKPKRTLHHTKNITFSCVGNLR